MLVVVSPLRPSLAGRHDVNIVCPLLLVDMIDVNIVSPLLLVDMTDVNIVSPLCPTSRHD